MKRLILALILLSGCNIKVMGSFDLLQCGMFGCDEVRNFKDKKDCEELARKMAAIHDRMYVYQCAEVK